MTQFDYQGVLTSKQYIAPDTLELRITLEHPASMTFQAGQFVNIQAGDRLFRPYSIASAPSQNNQLDFAIKLVQGGKASVVFEQITVGTTVNIKGPFGKFVVNDEADRLLSAFDVDRADVHALEEVCRVVTDLNVSDKVIAVVLAYAEPA